MSVSALVTAEQLARPPYTDLACELVDGRVVEVSPASWRHGLIAGRIMRALGRWADVHGGEVVSADTGFVLHRDPDTLRAPDVAFVCAGRELRSGPFVEGSPDIAVEVLSPDARAGATARRVRDYLDAGASHVWLVDLENRTVTVHTPPNQAHVLAEGDTLRGGGVLPGFELPIAGLFVR
jgi:Uma2 family endonuclease